MTDIKAIIVEINGEEVRLSLEDAKRLHESLGGLLKADAKPMPSFDPIPRIGEDRFEWPTLPDRQSPASPLVSPYTITCGYSGAVEEGLNIFNGPIRP